MKLTQQILDYYTGPIRKVWIGHARDARIARNAASGGFVTGLLAGMLRRGEIDGALVYRLRCPAEQGGNSELRLPKPEFLIARTQEELAGAQGSIYQSFAAFSAQSLAAVREFDGKLAVVALPCQAQGWRRLMEKDAALKEKIVCIVGLFCGHTSKSELLSYVLKRKQVDPTQLRSFRFREGLWRGNARAVLADGGEQCWPTGYFNLYQNLFIASAPQCMGCFDHFAEAADLCCGDIWLVKHKHDKVKHSIWAARTERGEAIAERAAREDLEAVASDQRTLFAANKRAAIYHKAICARARAARAHGVDIRIPEGARAARWNERLAARLAAYFIFASAEQMLTRPRKWLKLCLYVFKGLTNF